MSLLAALQVGPGDVVSLVGGGGKTSLALRLVSEATGAGLRAVFTTTTRIWPPDMPTVFAGEELPGVWPCCVAGDLQDDGKLSGLRPGAVAELLAQPDRRAGADLVVVEADGSGGRPLKFPLAHEPVIPACTTVVLPVAGAVVVGKPFTPDWVHRCASAMAFVGGGGHVTPEHVARLLWHPDAATRGRPAGARVVPVINQAETCPEAARAVGRVLLREGAPRVLLTAARSTAPVLQQLTREGA